MHFCQKMPLLKYTSTYLQLDLDKRTDTNIEFAIDKIHKICKVK